MTSSGIFEPSGTAPSALSRIRGCFLGGAIGDALGAPVEFNTTSQIRSQFGPSGLTAFAPAFGLRGAITDDTQMTLFTAEGLTRADNRGRDRGICNVPNVVRNAYLRWMFTQKESQIGEGELAANDGWLIEQQVLHSRRAPGNSCLSALRSNHFGTPDNPVNDSKGCGGVMRAAPIGFTGRRGAFDLGIELAALTHGHPSGYYSAAALADIVAAIYDGEMLSAAIQSARIQLECDDRAREVGEAIDQAVELANRTEPTPENVELLGAGWVGEEALAISIYSALTATSFMEGVLVAVNHSGDSDSTGAITGNILGAHLGYESLPEELLADLEAREVIDEVARDMMKHFGGVDGEETVDPDDYDRYPPY